MAPLAGLRDQVFRFKLWGAFNCPERAIELEPVGVLRTGDYPWYGGPV
jgi:hypothetical protein